jgi:hypothetical protein
LNALPESIHQEEPGATTMRVLVACEFSAIVRDAFRERGHDAWSCERIRKEYDQLKLFPREVKTNA